MGIVHKVSISYTTNIPPHLSSTMKVGHITCDNVSNNPTMTKELAACLKTTTGKKYNWKRRKIKFVGS